MKRGTRQFAGDGEDHRIEPLEVADLQHATLLGGDRDQFARLLRGRRDRLLDQHVGAGRQEIACDAVMQRGRRRNADRIDASEQLAMVRESGDSELGAERSRASADGSAMPTSSQFARAAYFWAWKRPR